MGSSIHRFGPRICVNWWRDLPPMALVGVPVAVADAHPVVQEAACWVTGRAGGQGAVREVCEWILEAHGVWEELVNRQLTGDTP